MAGKHMRVNFLVDMMLQSVSMRGKDDISYHIFETIYGMMREMAWPWNFAWTRTVTADPISSTSALFTMVAGSSTITCSTALPIGVEHTGRHFVFSDRLYRVVKVVTSPPSVVVDAMLHKSATDQVVTFFRNDVSVRSNSVFEVQVDGYRIPSSTKEFWRRHGGSKNRQWDPAKPMAYELIEDDHIHPPRWPPSRTGASSVGAIEAGTYKYFFTFYDVESGAESAPGPEFTVEETAAFQHNVGYSGPGGVSARNSYQLRLYRSKNDPVGDRWAPFLVGTIDGQSATTVTDNNADSSLLANERYYAGPSFNIRFVQPPDSVYSADIRHVDGWQGRPDPDDMVNVGRNNILTDLLPLGASIFQVGADRDTGSVRAAIINLRQQMNYLINSISDGNRDDPGIEEYLEITGKVEGGRYNSDPTSTYTWRDT